MINLNIKRLFKNLNTFLKIWLKEKEMIENKKEKDTFIY